MMKSEIEERLLKGKPVRFPDGLSDDQRTVLSNWVMAAVQKGVSVELDRAIIANTLNLESDHVSSPLAIRNSQCPSVNMRNATFSQVVCLDGTTFGSKESKADLHAIRCERDLLLQRTHFCGPVDLSDTMVVGGVRANDALFDGPLDAAGIQIGGQADFTGTTFEGKTGFSHMRVSGDLQCKLVTFRGDAIFNRVEVGGLASFDGATFERDSSFSNMHVTGDLWLILASSQEGKIQPVAFNGETSFLGVYVEGNVYVGATTFKKKASFGGMHVTGALTFGSVADQLLPIAKQLSIFEEEANFFGLEVGRYAIFQRTIFRKNAIFAGTHVTGLLGFVSEETPEGRLVPTVVFAKEATFLGTKVGEQADFRGVTFLGLWDLRDTQFTNLLIDEAFGKTLPQGYQGRFQGGNAKVDLRRCSYDDIRVYWRSFLERQDPFDRGPYMQFERTMRRMGKDDLADTAYYDRRCREGNHIWGGFRAGPFTRSFWGSLVHVIGDLFLRLVAGYGVRPWRMVGWIIVLPVIAGILFWLSPNPVQPVSIKDASLECAKAGWQGVAWLTLGAYLPFEIPSAKLWKPSECLTVFFGLKASSVASLLKLAGWIFLPTALATFTGLLRYVGSSR